MDTIDILKCIERGEVTPEKGAMLIRRYARCRIRNHFIKVIISTDDTNINHIPPIPIFMLSGFVGLAFGITRMVQRFVPEEAEHWLKRLNARDVKSIIKELRYCRYADIVDIETENGRTHILIRAF